LKKTKDGKLICWTPIFEKENGYEAGVDENGIWYSDTIEGLKAVDPDGGIGLLPILEMSREDFTSYLSKKLIEQNLQHDLLILPLVSSIISLSFKVSTYWAELGIEWLTESEIDTERKLLLNKLIEDKIYSQKFRHKAFAKIKRSDRLKTST
jgi:hypothetical protein